MFQISKNIWKARQYFYLYHVQPLTNLVEGGQYFVEICQMYKINSSKIIQKSDISILQKEKKYYCIEEKHIT